MHSVPLGSQGLTVSRQGLGCMGMSEFYGPRDDAESDRHDPPRARPRRHPPRHRRHVRPVHERGARRPRDRRPPRRGRARDQVRQRARRGRRVPRHPRRRRLRQGGLRGVAAPARRRPHRPLLPAPRRPADADRGDRRRDGRARRGGQGPLPRPVRGGARDDPPRARRAPDLARSRPSTRSGRATRRRRSCRRCASSGIGFVPYSPLGRGFLTGHGAPLDDLADDDFRRFQPRFQGDNLEANVAIVERIDALAARARRHAGADRARVGPRPGRRRRADPGHQAAPLPRGERRRARRRAERGRPRAARRRRQAARRPLRRHVLASTPEP